MSVEKKDTFKPNSFIEYDVLQTDIPELAKILYGVLNGGFPSFKKEGVWASRKYLADVILCKQQRVTELLKILKEAGLVYFNGYKELSNGQKIRLIKKVVQVDGLIPPKSMNLDPLSSSTYQDNIYSNIKEKEPSLSISSEFSENWKKAEYKDKFNFIHSRYPKIDSVHLRYVIDWQEKKIEKFFSFFKSDSNSKLIKQVVNSCDTIDKLIRIDKHYFRETIVPALKWASQDKFWSKKTLSIANLRGAGANDQNHFWHLHQQWCEAEEIDPRKGRYVLESEVIRTPMVNPKWTEYVNAKRKEQGIETDDPPEGLSQEGFEEFFKQKGTATI
jgi:hypothetical protein